MSRKTWWTLYLIEVMKVHQLPGEKCLLDTSYIFHTLKLTNRVAKCHQLNYTIVWPFYRESRTI